jgi:voltage-gated potassium channel
MSGAGDNQSAQTPSQSPSQSLGFPRAPIPRRKLVLTALTALIPLAIYFVIPLDDRLGKVLAVVLVVCAAAALLPLSIRQARLVLRSEQPLFDATRCIVSGLVFLITAFSVAYYVLGTAYDGQINGIETKLDALYFTVTIVATVGFGDVTATGQVARGVVTAQMIVNLAVLAVALRVVSWALKERGTEALARRTSEIGRDRT